MATSAYSASQPILKNKRITTAVKIQLLTATMFSVLLYAAET